MKIFFLILTSMIIPAKSLFALSAHEHGTVKLSMAIEKNKIEIDLDGPAESFLGFEYAPKTADEKKLLEESKFKWEKNLLSLIFIEGCRVSKSHFAQVSNSKEGPGHSDIEAQASMICGKPVSQTKVKLKLLKNFNNLKKINFEVIGPKILNLTLTDKESTVDL